MDFKILFALAFCASVSSVPFDEGYKSNPLLKAFLVRIFEVNHFDGRIVGGTKANDGQFPHQVSLRFFNTHFCGGSILNPTTILTAAHCVYNTPTNGVTVVTGTNTLRAGGNTYKVKSAVHHSKYNPNTVFNDIAIIELETPIQISDSVQPVKLPISEIGDNETLILSGWGMTSFPGNVPNELQYIELTTINLVTCAKQLQNVGEITNGHICTMSSGKDHGACKGDSGGPLMGEDGIQYGVVSWGVPCARGRPDVFTSVYHYKSWIEENTK